MRTGLERKSPATAATGTRAQQLQSRGASDRILTTALTMNAMARLLGGEVAGPRSIVCPGPGHSKHDRSLHITMTLHGDFRVHSYSGDEWKECRDYVKSILGGEPRPAHVERDQRPRADKRGLALKIWDEAFEDHSSLIRYSESRGLTGRKKMGHVLRFHPRCPWGNGETVPAMIGLFRHIHTDEPTGIHRTALKPDGSGKMAMPDGSNAKRMLGDCKGSAIKLCPDEEVIQGLIVAEGIETGLSVIEWGIRPVWAVGSAGAMQNFPLLPGVDALALMADHDEAGIAAARACAWRWADAGRDCMVAHPFQLGADWNDVTRGAKS